VDHVPTHIDRLARHRRWPGGQGASGPSAVGLGTCAEPRGHGAAVV